jgi:hypothetical protein
MPLIPVNPEGLDKIAEQLLNEDIPVNKNTIISKVNNPRSYLILEGKTHDNYSYPDLLVGITRLGYDKEVEKAAKNLGLSLSNTATEQTTGKEYIGSINWGNALKLNLSLDSFTLSLRQYIDFLLLLKSGNAFYGDKSKADKKVLDNILDEILSVRDPYRVEWLDADFKLKDDKLYVNYAHKLVNNILIPQKTELLENCIMEDCEVDLSSFNKQGLPTKKGNSFGYWFPRSDNNSVARFLAYSDWAYLSCFGNPSLSNGGRGVRRAKILK